MNQRAALGKDAVLTGTALVLAAGYGTWGTNGNWELGTRGSSTSVAALFEPVTLGEALTLAGPSPRKMVRCFLQPTVSVDENSEVREVGGGTYEVVGKPFAYQEPFSGTSNHIEVMLREKE